MVNFNFALLAAQQRQLRQGQASQIHGRQHTSEQTQPNRRFPFRLPAFLSQPAWKQPEAVKAIT